MRIEVAWILGALWPLAGCTGSVVSSAAPSANTVTTQAGVEDAGCSTFDGGLDEEEVAEGKTLVAKWECASCHQGDKGTLAGGMLGIEGRVTAFPPNLTPDPATGLGCWTDQQIETAMSAGVDNQGVPICVMPRFTLDSASLHKIVEYLRSLPPVSNQVPDTSCPS